MKVTVPLFAFSTLSMLVVLVPFGAPRTVYDSDRIVEMTDKLPCDSPQPRAYNVLELTNLVMQFVDPFVVLHRCGRAGCCSSEDEVCAPHQKENVTFNLEYFDDLGEKAYLEVSAENHLKCACRKTESSIK